MKMNHQFRIIFCALLIIKSETLANKVTCQYENSDILIFSTKHFDYSCEISPDFENYENITEIDGEHEEPKKSDGDVKILQISFPSKIQALTSVFCDKFNNLEGLKLENVEMKKFDENSIKKCQNLKLLHLSGNELLEIPEYLLTKNVDLVEIVISSNLIQSLGPNTFEMQVNMQKLFLHNNKIESLPSGIFKYLKNLKKLNLDKNKIEVLDAEWFDNLENLATLSVNSNKIAHLPQNIFGGLKNLQVLHMNNNSLTIINANSFGNYDKLTQICVNFNNIDAIDPEIVLNSSLSKLRMEGNACYNEIIESRNQMEEKLKSCFDNFYSAEMNLIGISVKDESNADINVTVDDDAILQVTSAFSSNLHNEKEIIEEIKYMAPTAVESDTIIIKDTTTTTTSTESSLFTTTATEIKEIATITSRLAQKPLNCGKADSSIIEISDDNKFTRGTYPWSAAIMKQGQYSPCSGVLVSERKVVTAGKCLYKYDMATEKIKEFMPLELLVVLGSHNIYNKIEKDRKVFWVSSLHIHDNYDFMADKMDADIAVIVLKETVEFTKFIQPICLMDLSPELIAISEGIVVSFGHEETEKKLPSLAVKKIGLKIYEDSECANKNEAFISISSNRTFCGGNSNGTGVCMEDIGSGLFVKYDDHFYLRGIVSVVVGEYESVCDHNTYSLFTDVPKFIEWIENITSEDP